MDEQITRVHGRVADWFGRAQALGWLGDNDILALQQLEQGTPADLFVNPRTRPLVVAFFGGTGVGKSSLLNRLAGGEIARVGVERPTSHEITVYTHQETELSSLPEQFPMEQVHIARHSDDARRAVLWVDMPDIDSTEVQNRQLAFAWLAHVDLLVYVVSPERYRDDVGWRVLRERGHRHGWMFVMNHWDDGTVEQLDDLNATLRLAGFDDPLVLHTCCGGVPCPDDEFNLLEAAIRDVQSRHGQAELERLGYRARLQDLAAALQHAGSRLGGVELWEQIQATFRLHWDQARDAIVEGMAWPIREVAAEFASRDAGLLTRLLGRGSAPSGPEAAARQTGATAPAADRQAAANLWDPWARSKLDEVMDTLEIALRRSGVNPAPLLQHLQQVIDKDAITVNAQLQASLRQGLAHPGTAMQRLLRRLSGAAVTLLPVTALLWAAWHVVRGFLLGTSGEAEFLGTNFAINSVLLVLVAWLLPWLLHRRLRPSVEKTVLQALHDGLLLGLGQLKSAAAATFVEVEASRNDLLEELRQIRGEIEHFSGEGPTQPAAPVARLLTTSD